MGDIFTFLSCLNAQISLFMIYKSKCYLSRYLSMSDRLNASRMVFYRQIASPERYALYALKQLYPKLYFSFTSMGALAGTVNCTFPYFTTYRQLEASPFLNITVSFLNFSYWARYESFCFW